MTRQKPASIAPPIIWGSILIAICLALVTLWNVVIVTDYMHIRALSDAHGASGSGRWIILAVGCVLFAGVLVGLIFFLISLIKQIRLNRAQQNFIDSVTHELKTPLTSLKLHLQTLQRGKASPEQAQAFHAVMLEDVERLSLLLDHVLAAARLERRQAISLEAIALKPLLDEVAGTIRDRYGLAPAAVRVDGADAEVRAERAGLHMVFLNLLDNAVKYSGQAVQVEVAIRGLEAGGAEVVVRDRGVGLAPKDLKRVFQRFYRVGSELTRTRPGTGLGLYIVRETLHLLGGRIRAESEGEGMGTTFVVQLPGGADV
ncbi:MAG TPA: HAMP domain-containing sensor histidine kinase [Pantanalinema sp.]